MIVAVKKINCSGCGKEVDGLVHDSTPIDEVVVVSCPDCGARTLLKK